MHEMVQRVFAASALALAPVAVEGALGHRVEPVYIREEDETKDGTGIVENGVQGNDLSLRETAVRAERAGHLVHRLAGRNNQMGHRFRSGH